MKYKEEAKVVLLAILIFVAVCGTFLTAQYVVCNN